MKIIAIDPGTSSGALAILDINTLAVEFFNLPNIEYRYTDTRGDEHTRHKIDDVQTVGLIKKISGPHVAFFIVETQSGYGQIPGLVKFGLGDVFGFLRSAILSANMNLEQVKSQTWKKSFDLKKTDGMSITQFKELSRLKAIELFPHTGESLRLHKSHNLAEALLIAEFGRRHILCKYVPGYQVKIQTRTHHAHLQRVIY